MWSAVWSRIQRLISRAPNYKAVGTWRGAQILRLHDFLAPALATTLAGGQRPPKIRLAQWLQLQWAQPVRERAEWLLRDGASWQYVGLPEFLRELSARAGHLLAQLERRPAVCVYVRDYAKSDFWVLLLVLRSLLGDPATRARLERHVHKLQLHVASVGGRLPRDPGISHFVLLDDASYSGEQLFETFQALSDAFPRATATVIVPFMSDRAVALFALPGVAVVPPVRIESLFRGASMREILARDLFLQWVDRPYQPEYWSYFQDFLGLRRYQTLTFFEHKIPDALSIPEFWLAVGPCLPREKAVALRVRPDRAAALQALLHAEVVADMRRTVAVSKRTWLEELLLDERLLADAEEYHGFVYAKLRALLQSEAFRAEFTEAVAMLPAPGARARRSWPALFPLIFPAACEEKYRKLVREMRAHPHRFFQGVQQDGLFPTSYMMLKTPACYAAPYKKAFE